MNKTISINIGGFVFNIEENAYQKLYHYLDAVKKNFTDTEEREEIMNDIESRIAEIFRSKLGTSKEVIVERDVEEVINVMGKPEEYVSDEFAGAAQQNAEPKEQQENAQGSGQKRLYRDTDHAVLGGVCSGLAFYFGIDVTLVRILFIVFSIIGGSGILIYLIMLFVVPEAKTTNDKLNMRGQPITVDNIKEHFTKIKNNIEENARSGKFRRTFNTTFERGIRATSSAANALTRFIGFAFLSGGVFGLILLITVLFGESGFFPVSEGNYMESLPTLLGMLYPGDIESSLVFLSLLVVTLIPLISIIILGSRLLFNIKRKADRTTGMKTLAISSSVLWLIAAAVLVITGIDLGMNFRNDASLEYEIPFKDSTNILYIDVMPDKKFSDHISYHEVWHTAELIKVEDSSIHIGYPKLYITEKNDSGNFEIMLYKTSHGISNKDASEKAGRIQFPVSLTGNRLLLAPYFTVPLSDKFRGQLPIVEVRVPAGAQVKFGKNIDRIDVWVSGEERYEFNSYSTTTWKPDWTKMHCLECERRKDERFF